MMRMKRVFRNRPQHFRAIAPKERPSLQTRKRKPSFFFSGILSQSYQNVSRETFLELF
jgi:hypothetical protein